MIKLQLKQPLNSTYPKMIPPMLAPKILDPLTPAPHIHWEISNLPPTPPPPWKTRKRTKIELMIKTHLTPPFPRHTRNWYPQCFRPILWLHRLLYPIFIEKLQSILQNCPNTQKNMTPNTDAPNSDASNAADNDAADVPDSNENYAAYPKLIHISLRNCNHNRKICPQHPKKEHDPQHWCPQWCWRWCWLSLLLVQSQK